jgi:hypothetical protein
MPAYGDWLEREHHPGLRRHMAEAGAPDQFADVVGSIIPIRDDQPATPAHWSVTFASADADATAAKGHRARRNGDRRAVRRTVVHPYLHNPKEHD